MDPKTNIRQFMDIIDEASLVDLAKSGMNKIHAAAGDQQAQGKEEVKKTTKRMMDLYKRYLGQTGGQMDEASLMEFLSGKIGFTAENVRKLFAQVGIQDPTKTESIMEAVNKNQVEKLMTAAAQFAYKHDLIPGQDTPGVRKPKSGSGEKAKDSTAKMSDAETKLRAAGKEAEMGVTALLDKIIKLTAQVADDEDFGEENIQALMKKVAETKGKFRNVNALEDRAGVKQELAIIGYAFVMSQIPKK